MEKYIHYRRINKSLASVTLYPEYKPPFEWLVSMIVSYMLSFSNVFHVPNFGQDSPGGYDLSPSFGLLRVFRVQFFVDEV